MANFTMSDEGEYDEPSWFIMNDDPFNKRAIVAERIRDRTRRRDVVRHLPVVRTLAVARDPEIRRQL